MASMKISKILVPVDFPDTSLHTIHEAAVLARHFHSEIIMLHAVTVQSHLAGVPESSAELAHWDLLAAIMEWAQKHLNRSVGPELNGLTIRRIVAAKVGAARAIMQVAREENVGLIMMPCGGPTFYDFLQSSSTAQLEPAAGCPVWTDAKGPESPVEKFAIRSVLCAVEFNSNDRRAVTWASQLAAEFGARLTLAHVTASVERWGPGGTSINPRWKEALVGDASQQIADLQKAAGIESDVFIGSGDVPTVLSQAVKETDADLLVTGCYPYGGRLRTHGYKIMCAVPIPVLSV
ncbi:MAG TPA: universal stress protein [Candidatus Acidoferrales bacterium]